MLFLGFLIFVTVTLGFASAYVWLAPTRTGKRLQQLAGEPDRSDWVESAAQALGPFAKLSTPNGEWESSPLRLKFINAGIRSRQAPILFFGAKTLLPIVFATGAYLSLTMTDRASGTTLLFYVLCAAMIGCYLPNIFLAMAVRHRQRELFDNFPDAADLMLVCVEAGLGLDAALTRVADEVRLKSPVLAEELHLTNLEMRAGATREKSLRNLALRSGIDEISTFATMLVQADKFGTSIGDALRVFSEDLRQKRQIRAEEKAAKIPTKLLLPLVLFIFPSIFMVVLGPAIIRIVRTLIPMISGGV